MCDPSPTLPFPSLIYKYTHTYLYFLLRSKIKSLASAVYKGTLVAVFLSTLASVSHTKGTTRLN